MSDPTFWTPPCSPKFGGDNIDILAELETDIFFDPNLSSPGTHGIIGLHCGRITCIDFLRRFENGPPTSSVLLNPLVCLGNISSNILILRSHRSLQHEDFTGVRNEISLLSTALLNEFRYPVYDTTVLFLVVAHFRSILLNLGPLDPKQNTHVFHAHLEVWISFIKLLDMIQKDAKLVAMVNSILNLEATSGLNAYGYFLDICLENLAFLHSTVSDSECNCSSYLWILLIRYFEQVNLGWFKYLHGKLIKLATPKRTNVYAPNTLERLRPDASAYLTTSKQAIWSLYWSLLATTAPLHCMYLTFHSGDEVSQGQLQKYSVVIWLIRKQFLGEMAVSENDAQLSLTSLLRLIEIWGPNIDIVRLLWLYFSRRLDHGLVPISEPRSMSRTPNQSTIRFSDWFSMVQKNQASALTSFELFCSLVRTVPNTEISEIQGILKFPLRSFTRQALSLYFLLLGHVFDAQLSKGVVGSTGLPQTFATLVNMLSDQFSVDTAESDKQNWDSGRRCMALQGVQYLILLCVRHWIMGDTSELMTSSQMDESFLHLVNLSAAVRNSLVPSTPVSKPGELTERTPHAHNLGALGWRTELYNLIVQFGLDLMELVESSLGTQELGLTIITKCIDESFFRTAGWPAHHQWNRFVKQFVSYVSRTSGENIALRRLIWSVLYPTFRDHIERKPDNPRRLSASVVLELSLLAFDFLHLSRLELLDTTGRNVSASFDHPLELLEFFAMDPKVEYSLRFAFVEACFGAPDSLEPIVQFLTLCDPDIHDVAWRLLTVWLVYCLLVRPAMEDQAQNQLTSFEHLSTVGGQISAYFPADVAGFFGEIEPELILLNLSAKFDQFETFHSKMEYKSRVARHLSKLCSFLCECCSPSSTAKDDFIGLEYCYIPRITPDTLCSTGYRAVSLLIRHCSSLLYSTFVTGGANSSPLEQLFNNFVLPRQLYEWDKLCCKLPPTPDNTPLPTIVIECMKDKLSEFTIGLAQLSWRSDAYIGRLLRDVVKLYYMHLDSECVANAVLNSPVIEFRAHLLHLSMLEAVNEVTGSDVEPRRNQSLDQLKRTVLKKWLRFCRLVHEGSHSLEGRQRDAPFIAPPILLAIKRPDSNNWVTGELRTECNFLIDTYRQAISSIDSTEIRKDVIQQIELIARSQSSLSGLCTFLEIKHL